MKARILILLLFALGMTHAFGQAAFAPYSTRVRAFCFDAAASAWVPLAALNAGDTVEAYTTNVSLYGMYDGTQQPIQCDADGNLKISLNLANGSTATTQAPGDNSSKIATTAYADAASSAAQAASLPKGSCTNAGNLNCPIYQETLTTPASSSAACTAGQFTDDANYHYVCVATNTWKRVALSTF